MRVWRLRWLLPAALLLCTLALLNLQACSEAGAEGYLNHAPEVQYVGKQECRSCHQDIYDSYVETGMGRSWYRPTREEIIENFEQVQVYDAPSDYYYSAYWRDDTMYIVEYRLSPAGDTTHAREEAVDYIVGSGNQTRSYVLDRNGYLYEAPITWYVSAQKWDLSPGYHNGHNSRFERPIGSVCMSCHNGESGHERGTLNRYKRVAMGIGCEQCHGPGEVHVERMKAGEEVDVGRYIDWSIVNPDKLELARQFDICQRCHLQGTDVLHTARAFRPGMNLTSIKDIFLAQQQDADAFGIASHASRLKASECFVHSGTKLNCTTCHDPHESVHNNTAAYYRKACMSCHADQACKAPMKLRKTNDDNCAGCHMPKGGTSDIPHVSFTDHKIRVVTADAPPPTNQALAADDLENAVRLICATSQSVSDDAKGRAYVKFFEENQAHPKHLQKADQLLADTSYFFRAKLARFQGTLPRANDLIKKAVKQHPNDAFVQYEKGLIEKAAGQPQAALNTFEALHARHPVLVEAGLEVVELKLKLGAGRSRTLQQVRPLLTKLERLQPQNKVVLTNLGFVDMNLGRYKAADAYLTKALAQDPDHAPALVNLIALHVHRRRKSAARKVLQHLKAKHPDHPQIAQFERKL